MVDGVLTSVFPPVVDPVEDRITARDRETSLIVAPWFHAMGTVGYLNGQIFGGTTMVVLPRFEPQEYMENLVKYRVTMIGGAPQLYIPLFNLPDFESYDLSTVKVASSGAAPLPHAVLHRMTEAFSNAVVREGYGLTECTMGATAGPPDPEYLKPGSVGIPVFDTELKVVDPETGEDLPPGQEGEICIRGPQLMQGYWNRAEETANTLKDGWLYTGDIGREDEEGYFYITDRKKDMIIYKGYNVYPREIEEVIFKHPAVQRCAVLGKPDVDGGEIPVAFVELNPGAQATANEIMEHTNSQVAPYKKIREVIFEEAIPVSPAGKVLKRSLREKLAQA
jgi:long-chain acyl-CoA synthetase